nr:hypothetical protein [Tanacetum cinerariifolium]
PRLGCDRLVSRAKVIENQVMAASIISISSDSSKESVVDPLVAPEVGTVSVVSLAGVLDLVDYLSSSDSDPSEDSLPPVPDLPSVMAASIISISSDSSKESVVDPLVAPEVGTVSVVSLAGVLDLVDYLSSSDSDPSEDSLPPVPDLPSVSPSGSSSHDTLTPSSEFPLALIVPYCFGSPTHDSRSIAPTPTDLLPPRKRFRDLYSPEDSGEEQMEVDTADAEVVVDVGISHRVVAHTRDGVGMRVEINTSDVREDDEEFETKASATDTREIAVDPLVIGDSFESSRGGISDLVDTIYDIFHYMSEVRIDRITEIETT